jgi:hypothetical protein
MPAREAWTGAGNWPFYSARQVPERMTEFAPMQRARPASIMIPEEKDFLPNNSALASPEGGPAFGAVSHAATDRSRFRPIALAWLAVIIRCHSSLTPPR